jgi:hypothetical protein
MGWILPESLHTRGAAICRRGNEWKFHKIHAGKLEVAKIEFRGILEWN